MSRKPKTNRVPKTRAGGEWTEAAFWGFLRSALRQASRRFPPITRHAMEQNRRESQGENKRQKWEYYCSNCSCWFPAKEVIVEHIQPCGSLKSWEDFKEFGERLFVDADQLTVHCKDCAKEKTKREKERSQ